MGRLITLIILVASPLFALSQYRWDYGGSLGTSNYMGEMSGTTAVSRRIDVNPTQSKVTIGAFARMKVLPFLSAKITLNNYSIAGADSLSVRPGSKERNLSFKDNLTELTVQAQFFFFEINDIGSSYKARNDLRLYIFAGFGGIYFNPKAYLDGKWYALQPLHTEGPLNTYNRIDYTIPAGGGVNVTIGKKYRLGWELGFSKTGTDYLDDVSTSYADPATFDGNEIAMALQNRNPEKSDIESYAELSGNYLVNQKRGSPKFDDYLIYSTFNISYVLRGKSSFYKSRYSSMFGGKKYSKKRKTRAKF